MAAQAGLSRGFAGNTTDDPKNDSCKAIELRNRLQPSNPKVSDERKESGEGEKKNWRKKIVVVKEVKKKFKWEKSEKKGEDEVRGDTLDKLIDINSPLRKTKKQIMNEPNPKLFDYIKTPYPVLKKKSKKEIEVDWNFVTRDKC